jgi:hypothetical protein
MHVTSSVTSKSSTADRPKGTSAKQKDKPSMKGSGSSTAKTKDKGKTSTKDAGGRTPVKDKNKASSKNTDSHTASMKAKKSLNS